MKYTLVFASVLAVATAQYDLFGRTYQPQVSSTPRPYQPYAVTTPRPYQPLVVSSPRPGVPIINRASNDQNANILRYENDINPDGSYSYVFETDNGIAAQAQGVPRDFGGNPPVIPVVSQGSFSWISPEGQTIAITYIADENGYQPQGDSIPTPPPIPAAIQRSLEFLARNAPAQK